MGYSIPVIVVGEITPNGHSEKTKGTGSNSSSAALSEVIREKGEPSWEKLDGDGNPLWGYTTESGTIDWYDSEGKRSPAMSAKTTTAAPGNYSKGTPINGNGGHWSDKRGNSMWIPDPDYTPPPKNNTKKPYNNPDGLTWSGILSKYGIEGIHFRYGEPDFSSVSKGKVKIDNFSTERHGKTGNFDKAAEKLATLRGCTKQDVKIWMEENNYTWHECSDCKTMQKVPNEIHANIHHDGGIAKAKNDSSSGEAI
jgi:hypothetical protein